MQLRFEPVVATDAALLGQFLAASDWPYHFEPSVNASWVRGRLGGYATLREEAEAP